MSPADLNITDRQADLLKEMRDHGTARWNGHNANSLRSLHRRNWISCHRGIGSEKPDICKLTARGELAVKILSDETRIGVPA